MTGGWCSGEKAVLVAVYEESERSGRNRLLPEGRGGRRRHHHHHHHHHHHNHFHVNVDKNNGRVRGRNYNRRAELLEYARHLRASSAQSSPPPHIIKQPSTLEISNGTSDKKRKLASPPTCFDKWDCIIPSFLRSVKPFNTIKGKGKKNHKKKTVSTKMNALVKSFQLQKKRNFLSQLFTTVKKRR